MADNKTFPVTDNLVMVQNRLYPVTHKFVVKRASNTPNWIDSFDGEILECYNAAVALRPGSVREMSQGGGHTFSITFANTPMRNGGVMLTPPYSVYEMECVRDWRGQLADAFVRYLEFNTGSWIGETGLPNSYTGHSQIMTLEYSGIPDLYYPPVWTEGERWTQATYYWYESWFDERHPGRPQHDYVFWLYGNTGNGWHYDFNAQDWYNTRKGVEIEIPPFSNFRDNMHVAPHTALSSWPNAWDALPRNDNLFEAGQMGLRVISNKWKHAPWERYPHLN